MINIDTRVQNNKKTPESVTGFVGGLNTFQDETVIRDGELTEAKNIILNIDGISPRPGTDDYGNDGSDSRVFGLTGFYLSNGTKEFIRTSGGKLKKLSGTSWTQIGSTSYTASLRNNYVQARDRLYIFNGTDALSYYDGSTITTYTALSTPGTVTVTPTGTTGSTSYSYRISAFNAVGETLAGTAGTTTTGNATLTTSNYNALSWSAVSNAVGYNIWGRKATGLGETYLATVYTNSFNDTGNQNSDDNFNYTPSTTILPPEADSTAGIKAKFACFAISRIFAAGDPNNPSRLYYGGVGTNIGNFSGSTEGGGYVDVFKNDGSIIRSILPFQGGVIVWKDNAIYKFSFNTSTGAPQLEEITRSFGGISFRGCRHVENDVIFPAKKDGRLAFYSLGNQENYAGSILRTNELSIKIASQLENVLLSNLENSCSFYFNNIYGCAITKSGSTTNDRIWCLDTRFGSWVYWEGISPNVFSTFVGTDGSEKLYYGSDTDGYVYEMFKEDRNDNGTAIDVRFSTKSFNQKLFYRYKKYYNPVLQFKDVNRSGALTGEIYVDGAILNSGFTVNQQTSGGAGVGASFPGFTLAGEADSGQASTTGISADLIVEVKKVFKGRSVKYNFASESTNFYFKFLSLAHLYSVLFEKRLPSSTRYYATG